MANKIQFKRGLKGKLPALSVGEPALCTDTKEFYIGNGSENIKLTNYSEFAESNKKLNKKANIGYLKKEEKNDFIDTTNYTVTDYYNMIDELVNSSRFDYTLLGKDQSDTYDIRLYRYVPTNYNSTIFVTCAVHGWEHYSTYMMYEVMKSLLDDENLNQQYNDLRNTRILWIPIANPWGLMADNHSGVGAGRRGNSRGVDINRNFDYKWEENTGGFDLSKGDSPFSEKESQYIRNVMESYNVTMYLDLHSFNTKSDETRDYLFYGNEKIKQNTYQFTNWITKVYPSSNISHTITENDSSSNNYANRVRDIRSMNIELIKGRGNDTKWYELVFNYLSFVSKSFNTTNYGTSKGCKIAQRAPKNLQSIVIPTTWSEVDSLKFNYNIDTDGIVEVNGFLCVDITGGDNTTTLTFSPYLSQADFYTNKTNANRSKPYVKQSSGAVYIPFTTKMFVRKGFGDCSFGIEVIKEGAGTITLKRSDAIYTFIPCEASYYDMQQHNKIVPW